MISVTNSSRDTTQTYPRRKTRCTGMVRILHVLLYGAVGSDYQTDWWKQLSPRRFKWDAQEHCIHKSNYLGECYEYEPGYDPKLPADERGY